MKHNLQDVHYGKTLTEVFGLRVMAEAEISELQVWFCGHNNIKKHHSMVI